MDTVRVWDLSACIVCLLEVARLRVILIICMSQVPDGPVHTKPPPWAIHTEQPPPSPAIQGGLTPPGPPP